MLLNLGSFLLIGLMTAYHIYNGFRSKGSSASNTAAIVFSFLTGCAFGAVAAQTFDWDISATLVIAAAFGIVAGFAGGIAFGLQPAVQGALSGLLGAMLGTVAGSLFHQSNNVVLVAAVTFIVGSLLIQKIKERLETYRPAGKKAAAAQTKPAYTGTMILAVCVAISAGYVFTAKNQLHIGAIGAPVSQFAVLDEGNDLQVASIDVTASGITPANTEFTSGKMIKAIFNVKPNAGTGLKLVSKDLNFSADLKPGQNIFLLNNPQPGAYEIVETNKAYKSTFTVKAENKK